MKCKIKDIPGSRDRNYERDQNAMGVPSNETRMQTVNVKL